MQAKSIIIMGVSGSGKTTIGKSLAGSIKAIFIDGDDLHPVANIEKMRAGIPLTDDDRWGWLQAISEKAAALNKDGVSIVIACSALKRKYRDLLRKGIVNVLFIYLKGSFEQLQQFLANRSGHFMPQALLQSQFDALEEPTEEEPDCITVPIVTDKVELLANVRSVVSM